VIERDGMKHSAESAVVDNSGTSRWTGMRKTGRGDGFQVAQSTQFSAPSGCSLRPDRCLAGEVWGRPATNVNHPNNE
jgi:hypothetical protein